MYVSFPSRGTEGQGQSRDPIRLESQPVTQADLCITRLGQAREDIWKLYVEVHLDPACAELSLCSLIVTKLSVLMAINEFRVLLASSKLCRWCQRKGELVHCLSLRSALNCKWKGLREGSARLAT